MARRLLAVTLLFCCTTVFSQSADEKRILLRGVVKDSLQNPVSYAHILSKNRNEGWITDYYGTFSAFAFPGDTLVTSAISYQRVLILIPEEITGSEFLTEIILRKDIVNLSEVVVRPWPATFEQLKKEFMEVEIEDPIANLDLHLPTPEELRNLAYPCGGIVVEGPVSAIYNRYSKEAISKRIYAELVLKERAGKRYNKEIVSKITGLKDEDQIRKFMEYCALQIKFILESSDYELYVAILGCYKDYCSKGYSPDPPEGD